MGERPSDISTHFAAPSLTSSAFVNRHDRHGRWHGRERMTMKSKHQIHVIMMIPGSLSSCWHCSIQHRSTVDLAMTGETEIPDVHESSFQTPLIWVQSTVDATPRVRVGSEEEKVDRTGSHQKGCCRFCLNHVVKKTDLGIMYDHVAFSVCLHLFCWASASFSTRCPTQNPPRRGLPATTTTHGSP